MRNSPYKKGDIVWANLESTIAGKHIQTGVRPAIVLFANEDVHEYLIAPLTTQMKKHMPTHTLITTTEVPYFKSNNTVLGECVTSIPFHGVLNAFGVRGVTNLCQNPKVWSRVVSAVYSQFSIINSAGNSNCTVVQGDIIVVNSDYLSEYQSVRIPERFCIISNNLNNMHCENVNGVELIPIRNNQITSRKVPILKDDKGEQFVIHGSRIFTFPKKYIWKKDSEAHANFGFLIHSVKNNLAM